MKTEINPNRRENPSGGYSPLFLILTLLFCICIIASNLMEIKTVPLGSLNITAGVIVFPLSYIINDCIVEIYGFRKARFTIWLGFGANFIVTMLLQIGIMLPGTAEWHHQEAMATIFGSTPRIMAASFSAFLCGTMVNAYVMSRMKRVSGEKGFSVRAIVSTLFGEGIDSLIFFPVAFGGILSWPMIFSLMVTQIILKTLYEIIVLPTTVFVVRRLRSMEPSYIVSSQQ